MSAAFIATAALRASLLLALGLAALRWLPVERPQLRRLAALVCLGASLVLPFLPVLAAPVPASWTAHALPGVDAVALVGICAAVWFTGGALAAVRLIFRGLALQRWLVACERLHPPSSFATGLPVLVCPKAAAPCVAGFLRPVLIVPEKALGWDESTWHCVLAHELQHVRQGDLWLGWITHAARVLHWWNPLAWQLSRRVGLECEACCDDAVLRMGVKAADYARVLLRFTTTEPVLPPASFYIHGQTPSSLSLRMERLLGSTESRVSAWRVVTVATLLVMGMAGCMWFGFQRMPPPSQDSGRAEDSSLRWQANPFPADAP